MDQSRMTRRPIAARDTTWAVAAAKWLTRVGARPNQISVMSAIFAACAGACLFAVPLVDGILFKSLLYSSVVVLVPLRLLCNMFDGMVAVEGGFRTKLGDLYNELPDRVSDVLVLVGAGYSVGDTAGICLGWLCAILAVLTAYIRAMGGVTGATQPFCGPMAKQQRMATIVAAAAFSVVEMIVDRSHIVMTVALAVIAAGCAITCVRRTLAIAKDLNAR